MPIPATVPGVGGPGFSPARLSASVAGSGGTVMAGVAGIEGFCVAFDDTALDPWPSWTRLDVDYRVQSWSCEIGRSYELTKTGTGVASVRLVDLTGDFDPTNTGGAFYGRLQPLKQAALALQHPVSGMWHTRFRGFVEDWDYTPDITEQFMVLEIRLVDAFDLLAAAELFPYPVSGNPVPAASAGDVFYDNGPVDDRIRAALADAGWHSDLTSIFSGNVQVQETVYAVRSSALSVAQDAADAEFPGVANLYVSRQGIVSFHGRFARFNPDVAEYDIDEWDIGDQTACAADATCAPVSRLGFTRAKDFIFNSVAALPQNIDDDDIAGQRVEDAASIAAFGRRSTSFENLLTLSGDATGNTANEECLLFAQYYVENYAQPRNRVDQIELRLRDPAHFNGAYTWNVLCEADISDLVDLSMTFQGAGGFSEKFFIEGIRMNVRPMSEDYPEVSMVLDVSPQSDYTNNPFT